MSMSYQYLENAISIYLSGGVFFYPDVEDSSALKNELISKNFELTGDPESHELLEKYYAAHRKNQGITFKIYLCKEIPWSSGLDFFNVRLKTFLKKIKRPKSIRLFTDADFDNGALILNNICVCRFSFLSKRSPFAVTFETDSSLVDEIKGRNMATTSVFNNFIELNLNDVYFKNKNVKKLKSILIEVGFINSPP